MDVLEVLNNQPIYYNPKLSRGNAVKKMDTVTVGTKDAPTSQVLQDSESLSLDAQVELEESHRSKSQN